MKREREDEQNSILADFRVQIVNATPQVTACKAMLYLLPDPNRCSWEQAQRLSIEDVTAIRALRKTIEDNMMPSSGTSSIEGWKATIVTAVEMFSSMPARCMMMKDPNDEEGFKRIAQDIQQMLEGVSPAELLKKNREEEKKEQEDEEEEQVESDTKKVKGEEEN